MVERKQSGRGAEHFWKVYRAGSYREAFQYRHRTAGGRPDASIDIAVGWMCETGHGTSCDPAGARRRYLAAAETDQTGEALFHVGGLEAREGNFGAAEDYLRRSAELGFSPAHHRLGWVLEKVGKDTEARAAFQEAARRGNVWAARRLTSDLLNGRQGFAGRAIGAIRLGRLLFSAARIALADPDDPRLLR